MSPWAAPARSDSPRQSRATAPARACTGLGPYSHPRWESTSQNRQSLGKQRHPISSCYNLYGKLRVLKDSPPSAQSSYKTSISFSTTPKGFPLGSDSAQKQLRTLSLDNYTLPFPFLVLMTFFKFYFIFKFPRVTCKQEIFHQFCAFWGGWFFSLL